LPPSTGQLEVNGDVTEDDLIALNVGEAAHEGERVQPIKAQLQQ